MPRPRQTVPSVYLNLAIPQPLAEKLELELFSEVDGRIPPGAYKLFFTELLTKYFSSLEGKAK